VWELIQREIERAGQLCVAECRLTVDPAIPQAVVLDPEATSEILSNLLDNARRHSASFIEVRVSSEQDRLLVEVTDDGPGLPSGLEARAFDRFVTLDGRGGTGLGLAIARELAQRQGGDLTYKNKVFCLRLPLNEVPSDHSTVEYHGDRLPAAERTQ
jgi:signal transduction histidine kinase